MSIVSRTSSSSRQTFSWLLLILLPFLIARRKELTLTRKVLLQLAVLSLVGFVVNKLFEFRDSDLNIDDWDSYMTGEVCKW